MSCGNDKQGYFLVYEFSHWYCFKPESFRDLPIPQIKSLSATKYFRSHNFCGAVNMSQHSVRKKSSITAMHIEEATAVPSGQKVLADQQASYEKSLTFWETLRIFWRATLWILYGQLVVFGYGIDGVIASYLLAVPRFRYGSLHHGC